MFSKRSNYQLWKVIWLSPLVVANVITVSLVCKDECGLLIPLWLLSQSRTGQLLQSGSVMCTCLPWATLGLRWRAVGRLRISILAFHPAARSPVNSSLPFICPLFGFGNLQNMSHWNSFSPNGTSVLIEVMPTPSVTESSPYPPLAHRENLHSQRMVWNCVSNCVHWDKPDAQLDAQCTAPLPSYVILFGPRPDGNLVGGPSALAFPQPPWV